MILSCEENQDLIKNCGDDPLENVDWLKALVDNENNTSAENSNGLEIIQYNYKDSITFLINNCINCADNLTVLYDCEKNKICEFGGIAGLNTCPNFEKEATNEKLLFTTRKNDPKDCANNPLQNIDWLKALVDNEALVNRVGSIRITQYTYKGNITFLIDDCFGEGCADNLATLYDCEKNKICEFGGIAGLNTCPDFEKEAIDKKVLFPVADNISKNCEKQTVIDGNLFRKLKASPIQKIEIVKNCIQITFDLLVTQDRISDVTLVDEGVILESWPTQRNLKFSITENLTKPITITATTSFDISNLAPWDAAVIILNIEGYGSIRYQRVPQCGDPNVLCPAENQKAEALALAKMLEELQKISDSVPCENAADWKVTPIGSKACGGPAGAMAYSIKIDVPAFLKKVEAHKIAEMKYNKKWGIVSTCDITFIPEKVICKNGRPTFLTR